jgi:hypothetical protein
MHVRSKKTQHLPAFRLELVRLPCVVDALAEAGMKFQTIGGTYVFPCDEGAFIINPNPRGVSPAATLTSLRVSPVMTQIRGIGAVQPFAAVGTYSDGSARCLTALVTWSSSDSSVTTISNDFGNGQWVWVDYDHSRLRKPELFRSAHRQSYLVSMAE